MAATEVQKDELRDKVGELVRDRFGGDYHKAFDHYDGDVKDGKISPRELTKLLGDAGVGNWLTRARGPRESSRSWTRTRTGVSPRRNLRTC